MSTTVDLTRGIYRKVWSGYLRGRRINKVSLEAEAMFFRMHALADDFGNLEADNLAVDAFPRRRVSDEQAAKWVHELVSVNLIRRYYIDGIDHLHIEDFEQLQPAGRNGKRIKRVAGPDDADQTSPDQNDPDRGGGIQNHPEPDGSAVRPEYESEYEYQDENDNETEVEYEAQQSQMQPAPPGVSVAAGSGSVGKIFLNHSGSDSVPLTRQKAKAVWQACAVRLIGMKDGSRHPPGDRQYSSDVTCVARIFESVWPEDRVDKPPGFDRSLKLAEQSKSRRSPLAWLQAMLKKESLAA